MLAAIAVTTPAQRHCYCLQEAPPDPPGSPRLPMPPALACHTPYHWIVAWSFLLVAPLGKGHEGRDLLRFSLWDSQYQAHSRCSVNVCRLTKGHTTEQRKISLQTFPRPCQVPCSENTELALILIAVGLEVAPSPGVSSAIFFVPGFLLLVPGVYHVIFIYCAVKGHRGFQFFYLPYFEK
ncbi:transmembrane protein 134 isoform X8 [Leopardus geoffroyi]|uniref:transmembrane protein 134 isoform X8 n=1 Tax=Leopardus geoffroyi TaxID=46844 RepID=UPI001E25D692|nr:transmembrane protein 134 isoform X8 [Leopardus geoffroyi]